MEALKKEFAEINKLKMFEIPVKDKQNEEVHVVCNIDIEGNKLVAQRDAVSTEEEESDMIASDSVDLDGCFSLDEHLQELYSIIELNIYNGDLYKLV